MRIADWSVSRALRVKCETFEIFLQTQKMQSSLQNTSRCHFAQNLVVGIQNDYLKLPAKSLSAEYEGCSLEESSLVIGRVNWLTVTYARHEGGSLGESSLSIKRVNWFTAASASRKVGRTEATSVETRGH